MAALRSTPWSDKMRAKMQELFESSSPPRPEYRPLLSHIRRSNTKSRAAPSRELPAASPRPETAALQKPHEQKVTEQHMPPLDSVPLPLSHEAATPPPRKARKTSRRASADSDDVRPAKEQKLAVQKKPPSLTRHADDGQNTVEESTAMKLERTPKFYVIKFSEKPYCNIDKYVCVPYSWARVPADSKRDMRYILVAYPAKYSSSTMERVKEMLEFRKEWQFYRARLVCSWYSFDKAAEYIEMKTIIRQKLNGNQADTSSKTRSPKQSISDYEESEPLSNDKIERDQEKYEEINVEPSIVIKTKKVCQSITTDKKSSSDPKSQSCQQLKQRDSNENKSPTVNIKCSDQQKQDPQSASTSATAENITKSVIKSSKPSEDELNLSIHYSQNAAQRSNAIHKSDLSGQRLDEHQSSDKYADYYIEHDSNLHNRLDLMSSEANITDAKNVQQISTENTISNFNQNPYTQEALNSRSIGFHRNDSHGKTCSEEVNDKISVQKKDIDRNSQFQDACLQISTRNTPSALFQLEDMMSKYYSNQEPRTQEILQSRSTGMLHENQLPPVYGNYLHQNEPSQQTTFMQMNDIDQTPTLIEELPEKKVPVVNRVERNITSSECNTETDTNVVLLPDNHLSVCLNNLTQMRSSIDILSVEFDKTIQQILDATDNTINQHFPPYRNLYHVNSIKKEISSYYNKHDDAHCPKATEHGQDSQRSFVLPPEYNPNDSRWTLKYPEASPQLVELMPLSAVYVDPINLCFITNKASGHKQLARSLLTEVFSENALNVCSWTGARSLNTSFIGSHVRPGLDSNARSTLMTYVECYGLSKGWGEFYERRIINTLRCKLHDIRKQYINAR